MHERLQRTAQPSVGENCAAIPKDQNKQEKNTMEWLTNQLRRARAIALSAFLGTTVAFSAAQRQPSTFGIDTIAAEPTPQALANAKQALQHGDVVVMEDGDVVRFNGLLGVGLIQDDPQLRAASPKIPTTIAARLSSTGSLHGYECYAERPAGSWASQGSTCRSAFDAWIREEQYPGAFAAPEPLPGPWTELGTYDTDYVDGNGNLLRDYVRLYRANDNNLHSDWYLVARDPRSAPNYHTQCGAYKLTCGFLTHKRDFQISASTYASNPGFSLYDWGPKNEIKHNSGSVDIGLALSGAVPSPGVGVSVPWDQPDVDTSIYTNIGNKEVSWVEDFSLYPRGSAFATLNNSQPFDSHMAAIFQVPEETTEFDVRLYTHVTSAWIDSRQVNPIQDHETVTTSRILKVTAPQFYASSNGVTLKPGGTATVGLSALIPGNVAQGLRWTVSKVPEGYLVRPMSGSGSQIVTITATSAQAGGPEDDVEFQTDPPYSTPSVERGPIQVSVRTVSDKNLPKHGVLFTGGFSPNGQTLQSAEIWDPATHKNVSTEPMNVARRNHTATRLADGTVLIAGGYDAYTQPLNSAEIFDPVTGKFTLLGATMNAARAQHTATLLTTGPLAGQVLIAGGCCTGDQKALNTAELYDPATRKFSAVGTMTQATMNGTASQLSDGDVLIAGGTTTSTDQGWTSLNQAMTFNQQSKTFGAAPLMIHPRQGQSATTLPNGQVLVAGGWTIGDDPENSAELYTNGSFTATGNMHNRRRYQAAALLQDGRVLEAGGANDGLNGEVYDPRTGTFQGIVNLMSEDRGLPTATLITNTETGADGLVLVGGGATVDLFIPGDDVWTPAGKMAQPRVHTTATLF